MGVGDPGPMKGRRFGDTGKAGAVNGTEGKWGRWKERGEGNVGM